MAITLNEVIRKSRMKREFQVRFCERVGVVSIPALLDFFFFFCQHRIWLFCQNLARFTPLSIFADFQLFLLENRP